MWPVDKHRAFNTKTPNKQEVYSSIFVNIFLSFLNYKKRENILIVFINNINSKEFVNYTKIMQVQLVVIIFLTNNDTSGAFNSHLNYEQKIQCIYNNAVKLKKMYTRADGIQV